MIQLTQSDITRFWGKITKTDGGCWLWGGHTIKGYGSFYCSSATHYAHRIAYTLVNGAIPEGLHCLHRCDVPLCCNPSHLFLGTNSDNMADKVSKGRQSRGAPHSAAVIPKTPRGIDHPRNKLSEEDVLLIRAIHARGEAGARRLGKRFGVSPQTIQGIVNRKFWTHI